MCTNSDCMFLIQFLLLICYFHLQSLLLIINVGVSIKTVMTIKKQNKCFMKYEAEKNKEKARKTIDKERER